jgi:hypothetical protein
MFGMHMRIFARFVCLLTMLSCGSALAESMEGFGDRMSHFYLAPSQEAFNTLQQDAEHFSGELKEQSGTDWTDPAF